MTASADQVVVGLGAGQGRYVDRERVSLERRLAAKGIHSFAVHPGVIATEPYRASPV